MKTSIYAAFLLAGASLGLAACGGGADDAATAGPDAEAPADLGLALSDARMVLPAVEGNPGVIYFTVTNNGDRNRAIRSASVEGAGRAEMHDTAQMGGKMVMGEMAPLMLASGQSATFEAGGKHVMVFDLTPQLAAGGTAQLTLTVAGGKTATFPVPIQAAGDDR